MAFIGIDFGTEFSSVAVKNERGDFEVVPDEGGKLRVASCVSFYDDEIRVGNLAELKREDNEKNTIYDIKMLIGVSLKKGRKLKEKYNWPFDLVGDAQDRMQVQVNYLKSIHQFYPEEIVSILFRYLIEIAEKKLQQRKVCGAVISVPTAFNHCQRRAIMDAGRIANLEVTTLLNDTTAAAVYYAFMHRCPKNDAQWKSRDKQIMVINIGAGSFSVSICNIYNHLGVTVISSEGDSTHGGRDVNREMLACLEQGYGARVEINKVLDKAKKEFSSERRPTTMDISETDGKMKSPKEVPRQIFEKACLSLKNNLGSAIEKLLIKLRNNEITEVILVGGSTRLPLVNELLEYFNLLEKIEKKYIKTDETVALGACIIADERLMKEQNWISEKLSYAVYEGKDKKLWMEGSKLPKEREFEARIAGGAFKILAEDGSRMLSAEIGAYHAFRYLCRINQDGLISISSNGINTVSDGIAEAKIKELMTKHSQFRQSEAERKWAANERHDLELTALHTNKHCKDIEQWLKDNQDSTLDDVRQKMQIFGTDLQKLTERLNLTLKNKSTKHVENHPCSDRSEEELFRNRDLQEENATLERALEDSKNKNIDLEAKIEEILDLAETNRKSLEHDNACLKKELSTLEENWDRAEENQERLKYANARMKDELSALKETLDRAETNQKSLEHNNACLQNELSRLKETLDQAETNQKSLEDSNACLKGELSRLKDILDRAETNQKSLKHNNACLKDELSTLKVTNAHEHPSQSRESTRMARTTKTKTNIKPGSSIKKNDLPTRFKTSRQKGP